MQISCSCIAHRSLFVYPNLWISIARRDGLLRLTDRWHRTYLLPSHLPPYSSISRVHFWTTIAIPSDWMSKTWTIYSSERWGFNHCWSLMLGKNWQEYKHFRSCNYDSWLFFAVNDRFYNLVIIKVAIWVTFTETKLQYLAKTTTEFTCFTASWCSHPWRCCLVSPTSSSPRLRKLLLSCPTNRSFPRLDDAAMPIMTCFISNGSDPAVVCWCSWSQGMFIFSLESSLHYSI